MATTTHLVILVTVACTPASSDKDDSKKALQNAAESGAQSAYYSLIEPKAPKFPPPQGDTGVRPPGHDFQGEQHHDYRWLKRGTIRDTGTVDT